MNSFVILVLYFYRENSSISYNKVLEIHTWIVASLLSNEPRLLQWRSRQGHLVLHHIIRSSRTTEIVPGNF